MIVIFLGRIGGGWLREGLTAYPYLLMVIHLWTGYWYNHLESMDMRMDEDNGKAVGMVKGQAQKVWQFSRNEFWKCIGCLISAHTFGLGGSRLWHKD